MKCISHYFFKLDYLFSDPEISFGCLSEKTNKHQIYIEKKNQTKTVQQNKSQRNQQYHTI